MSIRPEPDSSTRSDRTVHNPLADLGWDPGWAELAAGRPGHERPGRVLRADRGSVLVDLGAAEPVRVPLAGSEVTTGDWVLLAEDPGGPVLAEVLPRRTALVRGAGRRDARAQVLAANVDLVLVVVALATAPNLSRLDRLLTVAWESGAEPVIVLTMADLAGTADSERDEVAAAAPGATVLVTSTVDGRGLDELRALLVPGRTVTVLGSSGAGKSSLLNALAGEQVAAVGAARSDGKGRHTTVSRELVVLPGLGVLLDTPGLRGVQLWDAEDGLDRTFADVVALADGCRFADCRHAGEPGCAVAEAIEDGRLPARRLASYQKLERETTWLQSRYDARLRAEQRRQWKNIHKQMRGRNRP